MILQDIKISSFDLVDIVQGTFKQATSEVYELKLNSHKKVAPLRGSAGNVLLTNIGWVMMEDILMLHLHQQDLQERIKLATINRVQSNGQSTVNEWTFTKQKHHDVITSTVDEARRPPFECNEEIQSLHKPIKYEIAQTQAQYRRSGQEFQRIRWQKVFQTLSDLADTYHTKYTPYGVRQIKERFSQEHTDTLEDWVKHNKTLKSNVKFCNISYMRKFTLAHIAFWFHAHTETGLILQNLTCASGKQ